MTESRKHELFNQLLGWVCEHVSNDEELYHSLHDVIGFTDSEIEESGIDYLNLYFEKKPDKCMLFSKVILTADNGSTDTYLCPGLPDCEEQIADTDGYIDFLEENPDTDSIVVEVERYSYGEGESENADDDEIAELEKQGESFLNSDAVDYLGYDRFIILTDNEDLSMEGMT